MLSASPGAGPGCTNRRTTRSLSRLAPRSRRPSCASRTTARSYSSRTDGWVWSISPRSTGTTSRTSASICAKGTASRSRSPRSRTTARSTCRSRPSRTRPRASRVAGRTKSSSRSSRSSCVRARSARSTSGAPPSTSASSEDPMPGEHRASDVEVVRGQLGRPPTTRFDVIVRCAAGHPLVIRNAAFDGAGAPFPTTFWLTCPDAVAAVSRREADGEIGRLNERYEFNAGFREAVDRAHTGAAEERARLAPEARSWGGVGGTRRGIKCLHAHYANHLAGAEDVVGAWVGERVEPIHAERDDGFAVMDQGTNSTRRRVAEPTADGGFVDLARDLVITRLGQGVDGSGRLAPQALERVLEVVDRYVGRARALHARTIRMTATAAVRDASNRDELARAIAERTGSPLEIASGEQEAELSFVGATRGLEADAPFLVVDIGGGSTEFVLGTDRPAAVISVQMGSVRLTERFVRHD